MGYKRFASFWTEDFIEKLSTHIDPYDQRSRLPGIHQYLTLLENPWVGTIVSGAIFTFDFLKWCFCHPKIEDFHLRFIVIPSIVIYDYLSLLLPGFDSLKEHRLRCLLIACLLLSIVIYVPQMPILIDIIFINFILNLSLYPLLSFIPYQAITMKAIASIPPTFAFLAQMKSIMLRTLPMTWYISTVIIPLISFASIGFYWVEIIKAKQDRKSSEELDSLVKEGSSGSLQSRTMGGLASHDGKPGQSRTGAEEHQGPASPGGPS